MTQNEFLRGQRINPKPVTGKETVADLVDNAFLAYNAGRLVSANCDKAASLDDRSRVVTFR